jgi:hypothetical protein
MPFYPLKKKEGKKLVLTTKVPHFIFLLFTNFFVFVKTEANRDACFSKLSTAFVSFYNYCGLAFVFCSPYDWLDSSGAGKGPGKT